MCTHEVRRIDEDRMCVPDTDGVVHADRNGVNNFDIIRKLVLKRGMSVHEMDGKLDFH